MKRLLFILILLSGCSTKKIATKKYDEGYPKYFMVGTRKYEIYLGSDGHEYYEVKYYINYIHYPNCKLCFQGNQKVIATAK